MSEKCPCCLQPLVNPIPLDRGDIWWDYDDGEVGYADAEEVMDSITDFSGENCVVKVARSVKLTNVWATRVSTDEVRNFATEAEALASMWLMPND